MFIKSFLFVLIIKFYGQYHDTLWESLSWKLQKRVEVLQTSSMLVLGTRCIWTKRIHLLSKKRSKQNCHSVLVLRYCIWTCFFYLFLYIKCAEHFIFEKLKVFLRYAFLDYALVDTYSYLETVVYNSSLT